MTGKSGVRQGVVELSRVKRGKARGGEAGECREHPDQWPARPPGKWQEQREQ